MKIALFYSLEGVLLSTDPKKNVSTFHKSMVDDLDMFNYYPWGIEVYETILESLRGKDLVEKYHEHMRKPSHK